MTRRLAVVMYGQIVGHLERAGGSGPTFTYAREYAATGTVPLSVRMPIAPALYDGRNLQTYLDGLVPESIAVRSRWGERFGVDPDDSFALLAHMGWDCPGAVQFCRPEEVQDMIARAEDLTEVSDAEIADRLRTLKSDAASWTLPDEHWSLPGQQEKFALAWRDGVWLVAAGSSPTTHIFKPGITHLHHQALIEHATMRAAASAGVAVASSTYALFEDQPVIIVERFDRISAPDGRMLRIHQEDFCQATGFPPSRKYESRNGPGLAAYVRVIDTHSSDPAADKRALADFLIVNYVAGAPDGHAKNLSITLLPGRVSMAPLYDLATGFPYEHNVDRTVALSIGGVRKFGQVRAKQWRRAAVLLGVDPDWMLQRVAHLASVYPAALAEALREIATPAADEVLQRTWSRLERHCATILDQLI